MTELRLSADMSELRSSTGKLLRQGRSRHPTLHLVNGRGIDTEQESTAISVEFLLHSQPVDHHTESFTEMRRRRVTNFQLEVEIEQKARQTLDQFEAIPGPAWQGPVVLRDAVLAIFMNGGVLQTLVSAKAKYAKFSNYLD